MCSDAPDTTPMAIAAAQSSAWAKEAADKDLAFRMASYNDLLPYLKGQLETGVDQSKLQADIARKQADIGFENDAYQKETFRPIEKEVAREAMDYGSAADQERQAGQAVSDVGAQFDTQRAQNAREESALNLDPSSGAARAGDRLTDVAEALGKANAATGARVAAKDKGIALRSGAASFGRNMTNTAGQSLVNSVNSGATAANTAGAGVQGSIAASNSAAQGFNGQYDAARINLSGAQAVSDANFKAAQMNADSKAGIGQMIGMGAMMMSSRGLKRNKKSIDKDKALDGLAKQEVGEWDYKEGAGDGGRHIGPYAEDMHAEFGDTAAPGGVAIDVISNEGLQTAAIGALNDKVTRLERRIGGMRRG